VVERGRKLTADAPADRFHTLRKDAKRLRYLLECFAGPLAPAPRKRLVKRLKRVQRVLGDHQDCETYLVTLRTVAEELGGTASPDTMLAIGELIGGIDRDRIAARAEFAEQFDAFDRRSTRGALDAALDGLRRRSG
jgi:CHAD domain-containing protein